MLSADLQTTKILGKNGVKEEQKSQSVLFTVFNVVTENNASLLDADHIANFNFLLLGKMKDNTFI